MDRRKFLMGLLAGSALIVISGKGRAMGLLDAKKKSEVFPYQLTDAEWKKKLSPDAYNVLRRQGTEPAFSSALYNEHRKGTFNCAGCDWLLFLSDNKFESGTGWPSFWQPANDKAVQTSEDDSLLMARTEVHCAHCGGHLGHVFNDGPKPTGLRYCINGVALGFRPIT